MDNETRSWLIAVPFDTHDTPANDETRAFSVGALTVGQKRELASFTGLVMATTVFFLTPLLRSPEPQAPAPRVPTHAEVAVTLPVVATPQPAVPEARPVVHSRRPARAAVSPVATAPSPSASAPAKEIAREKRKGISGTLMRVLVGNGRHRVQPFPTPASGV